MYLKKKREYMKTEIEDKILKKNPTVINVVKGLLSLSKEVNLGFEKIWFFRRKTNSGFDMFWSNCFP